MSCPSDPAGVSPRPARPAHGAGQVGPARPGPRRLRLPAARRIALAAQGFDRPRPAMATMRDVQRVIDTLRIVQIDSVNVLARSQYLPFYSRLGAYDTALLDRARDAAPRRVVEYWAHEASLVRPADWSLYGFRMRRAHDASWGGMQRVAREHPDLVEQVYAHVAAHGPVTCRAVEAALAHERAGDRDQWGWNWSLVKNALEHLFWAGRLTSAGRTASFERRYELPARVLPPTHRHQAHDVPGDPADDPARFRALVEAAARAHGVGTLRCLRDYSRLTTAQAAPAVEALVADGVLEPVSVDGWGPAYLHAAARRPRAVPATALLSPFDSLVWQRERIEALFGFTYRLEIYVPAAARVHGYYVLPFLHDERLVGRVDLAADRRAGVLRVRQVTWEPGAGTPERAALDAELQTLSAWLGLPDQSS